VGVIPLACGCRLELWFPSLPSCPAQIYIQYPVAGEYKITISLEQFSPTDGDQPFSLVVSASVPASADTCTVRTGSTRLSSQPVCAQASGQQARLGRSRDCTPSLHTLSLTPHTASQAMYGTAAEKVTAPGTLPSRPSNPPSNPLPNKLVAITFDLNSQSAASALGEAVVWACHGAGVQQLPRVEMLHGHSPPGSLRAHTAHLALLCLLPTS